jgi:hypothetical protein
VEGSVLEERLRTLYDNRQSSTATARGAEKSATSGSGATFAISLADAEFGENDLGGAKAGESGLEQIKSNEGSEPEPMGIDPVPEGEAGKDEGARQSADSIFQFHRLPFFIGRFIIDCMSVYSYS